MKIHIVKKGDTLYELSKKYNVSLEKIIEANPDIANPDQLNVGMKVKIPTVAKPVLPDYETMHKHTVSQGDTLWKLSKAWGVPLQDMIKANPQLKNPNALLVGEVVNIPKVGHVVMPDDDKSGWKKPTGPKPAEPTQAVPAVPMQPAVPAAPVMPESTYYEPMEMEMEMSEDLFAQFHVPATEAFTHEMTEYPGLYQYPMMEAAPPEIPYSAYESCSPGYQMPAFYEPQTYQFGTPYAPPCPPDAGKEAYTHQYWMPTPDGHHHHHHEMAEPYGAGTLGGEQEAYVHSYPYASPYMMPYGHEMQPSFVPPMPLGAYGMVPYGMPHKKPCDCGCHTRETEQAPAEGSVEAAAVQTTEKAKSPESRQPSKAKARTSSAKRTGSPGASRQNKSKKTRNLPWING
ncbi:LysM peptidoglycan-binding domain-containing protein [Paenibacillus sp. CECT 9249]|uniref:LysM peptidoglycan-binding domain-containing protein n=1 Tax=unclassified Paenibacillus TaxID=185978 RepID=UPI001C1143A5|nr:LysM peptidoglycan-binding domain-containing protein [Paenibacillus sp. MSJ-34]CAH0119109.1 hypothetical protein PAE9249_01606 [Paenibacillus sp. CECT 9249]